METIYFLIVIGVGAIVVIWATRSTKSEKSLAQRRAREKYEKQHSKLAMPVDNRLSHKEEIWKARCKDASEGLAAPLPFIPKFEAESASQYDGYSRRDRHHLTAEEHIKKEGHIDQIDEFTITSAEAESDGQAARS